MTARGWIVQLLAISIHFSTHHHHHNGSKTTTMATATIYPPAAAKRQQQQSPSMIPSSSSSLSSASASASSSASSSHQHQATITNIKKQAATTATTAAIVDSYSDSDDADEKITEITILKIGGSSITNKALEETLNRDALHWFSKLVANSIDPSFLSSDDCFGRNSSHDDEEEEEVSSSNRMLPSKPKLSSSSTRHHTHTFIVVHGAGSFGHHSAKRYGLKCGKATFLEEFGGDSNRQQQRQQQQQHHQRHPHNVATKIRQTLDSLADEDTTTTPTLTTTTTTTTSPKITKQQQQQQQQHRYQMRGLAKTRQSVQKLNAACVSSLVERGVNAIGISPGMTYHRLRGHGATAGGSRPPKECDPRWRSYHRRDDSPRDDSISIDGDDDDDDDGDDDDNYGDGSSSRQGMRDLIASIKRTLHSKLVPVVHGDACLLHDLSAGILGGDTLAEGIATCWDDVDDVDDDNDNDGGKRAGCSSSGGGGKTKIARVIFITDVGGVYTSDPNSTSDDKGANDDDGGGAELIRCILVDGDTGELRIDNRKDGTANNKREQRVVEDDRLNVSGSSHSHDVTGGLKAKLGAAVAIVQAGIDVIISKCGTDSTETFVKGNWHSIYEVEEGTLLSSSSTQNT